MSELDALAMAKAALAELLPQLVAGEILDIRLTYQYGSMQIAVTKASAPTAKMEIDFAATVRR